MRSAIGFMILAVGLAFGAITYFPHLGEPTFATPWTVLTPAEAAAQAASSPGAREAYDERLAHFSEGAALLVADAGQVQSDATPDVTAAAGPSADDGKADVALQPWRSAVLTEPSGLGPDGNQVRADRLDTAEKAKVAADIQIELQRVGCYTGEIDGVWGGASRRALATFLDRVNAALPSNEPDVILLTLIRAQPAGTCGVDCPSGQELNGADQCVPSAILAQAGKPRRSLKPMTAVAAVAPVSVPAYREPLPGRMSVGAYVPDATAGEVRTADLASDPPQATRRAATSFDDRSAQRAAAVASPAREKRRVASSAGPQRSGRVTSGYRAVQRLFENPLGRL